MKPVYTALLTAALCLIAFPAFTASNSISGLPDTRQGVQSVKVTQVITGKVVGITDGDTISEGNKYG